MRIIIGAFFLMIAVPVLLSAISKYGPLPAPLIAQDLPDKPEDANNIFSERVADRFPVGSSEEKMVKYLQEQGFEYHNFQNPTVKYLEYKSNFLLCEKIWRVVWKSNEDKITQTEAVQFGGCH